MSLLKGVSSASLERLEKLIRERLMSGADTTAIDKRIWSLFGDTWAIMFTDLSGFSRATAEFGIIHFLQIIYESQRIFMPIIYVYDGIVIKVEGDSMMIIFRTPDKAVKCGLKMQAVCKEYNKNRNDTDHITLCLGIGYGKVLKVGDNDIFGAELNAACKLGEDTAQPGEILVTGAVKKACTNIENITFDKLDFSPPGAEFAFKINYPI